MTFDIVSCSTFIPFSPSMNTQVQIIGCSSDFFIISKWFSPLPKSNFITSKLLIEWTDSLMNKLVVVMSNKAVDWEHLFSCAELKYKIQWTRLHHINHTNFLVYADSNSSPRNEGCIILIKYLILYSETRKQFEASKSYTVKAKQYEASKGYSFLAILSQISVWSNFDPRVLKGTHYHQSVLLD